MSLREWIKEDLPVIRKAPFAHGAVMLVGWIVAFVIMFASFQGLVTFYKERAERFETENDDLVDENRELRAANEAMTATLADHEPLLSELADLKSRSTVQLDHVAYLTPYVEQGNRLLTMEIDSDAELTVWIKRVGAWEEMVSTYLGLVSRPTAQDFTTATISGGWVGYNDQHSREREA